MSLIIDRVSDADATAAKPSSSWHTEETAEVLGQLDSDARLGLDEQDAAARLSVHGANEIEQEKPRTILAIVAVQFTDLMILILIAAALISGAFGAIGDMLTIAVIVMLNAAVGATQEYRAQRAIAALRKLSALEARVTRNGNDRSLPATELVPGDIVTLEAGNVVPADLRLIDVTEMAADESALTGEAMPVDKDMHPLEDAQSPVGDRRNMAFKSTSISKGQGKGVVVATGLATEIGRIAGLLARRSTLRTPLQQRLTVFSRRLALGVIVVSTTIFFIGLLNGEPPVLMFLVAVSLAVAAIPEALPAVVTVSLAIGARKLSRQKSLVRRLNAVESLGSVTYICSDKTGTLTENRMTLASIFAAGDSSAQLDGIAAPVAELLGRAMAMCNEVDDSGQGDPTEVALMEAARAAGFVKQALLEESPRIAVFSFDTSRKLMTTLHRQAEVGIAYIKGAPEQVIALCSSSFDTNARPAPLDPKTLLAKADELAGHGYRVLAVALKALPASAGEIDQQQVESDLALVGLVALHDPVRAEVPQAIADCRTAGITPVMITGDHPVTARQIASAIGLASEGADILTGKELAELSDDALKARARRVQVYARVDPEQKIRIVEALQANGELVAMTGDGVNDAPALKQATIGVAMGQRGTDVARETADLVLLDDNFATIVVAIREGRRVYDNIRKFIRYTMTSNTGEIGVLLLASLIGLPIPLLPIHILWINLVTDGLPGLAFSAEPAEANIMRRRPRPPTQGIFSEGLWQHMLWIGALLAVLALGSSAWVDTGDSVHWQTMVFTTLVAAQLVQAIALRSESQSVFAIGIFSNTYMLTTVISTLILQVLVVYLPFFNAVLHTTPLPFMDLIVCLALGSVVLPAIELQKWIARRRRRAAAGKAEARAPKFIE